MKKEQAEKVVKAIRAVVVKATIAVEIVILLTETTKMRKTISKLAMVSDELFRSYLCFMSVSLL
jgi:ribosome maturation protein Sdo1